MAMLALHSIKYSLFFIAVFKGSLGRFTKPTNVAQTIHGASCLASVKSNECTKAIDGMVTHSPSNKWGFHGWPNNTWLKVVFDDTYKIGQLKFMQMYYAEECNFKDIILVFTNGGFTTEKRVTLTERNNAYDLEIFNMDPPIIASSVNISVLSVYILSSKVYSGFMEVEVYGIDASLPWPNPDGDTNKEVVTSNLVTTTKLTSRTGKTTTRTRTDPTPLPAHQKSGGDNFNIIVYGPIIAGLVLIIFIILVIAILLYRKSRRHNGLDDIDDDMNNITPLEELRLRREHEIGLKNGFVNPAATGMGNDNNVYTNNEKPNFPVSFYSGDEHVISKGIGKETIQSKQNEKINNNLIYPERRNVITGQQNNNIQLPNQHKPLKRLNENKLLETSPHETAAQFNLADALRTAVFNRNMDYSNNTSANPIKTDPIKSNITDIMAMFDTNLQVDDDIEHDYVNVSNKINNRTDRQKSTPDYVNVKRPGDTEDEQTQTSDKQDMRKKRNHDYVNVNPHSRIN